MLYICQAERSVLHQARHNLKTTSSSSTSIVSKGTEYVYESFYLSCRSPRSQRSSRTFWPIRTERKLYSLGLALLDLLQYKCIIFILNLFQGKPGAPGTQGPVGPKGERGERVSNTQLDAIFFINYIYILKQISLLRFLIFFYRVL